MARFRIVHNTNSVVYRTDEHVGQISSCKIGCNISDIQSDFSYQPLWTTYSTFDVISKERLCCYPLTLRPSKTYVNNWCSRVALKQLHCVVFSQKGHGCLKDFLLYLLQAEMMEKELEERLRAEKATPSAASTSASLKTSPLGGLSRQMSKGPFIRI